MHPNEHAAADPPSGVVLRVLDPAFGFFVWAIHFLLIYILQSVACATGWANGRYLLLVALLTAATVISAALVIGHGFLHRRKRDRRKFMRELAMGLDAVAAAAILWQLLPILLFPLC